MKEKNEIRIIILGLIISLIISAAAMPKVGAKLISTAAIFVPQLKSSSNKEPSFEPNEVKIKSVSASSISSKSEESATASKENKPTKKEKAEGKILSQFFSPTSATDSFGSAYLNNRSGQSVDIKSLIESEKTALDFGSEKPQVLIVHTHATENYMQTEKDYYTASDLERTKKEKQSVIGIGSKVAALLEKEGISVIHDKTLHDYPSYSGAYSRSYETVSSYLEKHSSIKLVLDIHRDAIASGDDLIKPIAEVDGKNAAQVMICVGSQTGVVADFPNWKKNLALGLRLHKSIEALYPGLARPLYLAFEREYNQSLHSGSLIIEFGTNANTFSEADYSAELVASAIIATFRN